MINERLAQLAALVEQLEEQLLFYRDIGITDIGGAFAAGQAINQLPAREVETGARESSSISKPIDASPSEQLFEEVAMPKKESPAEQTNLFGETLSPDSPAAAPPRGLFVLPPTPTDPSLEAIRADIGDCTRCKLHEQRTKIVFGEGNPHAQLVFVGEGPGADEDTTGRPFVGRAGQLLDKIIAAIGLKREDVYIANVVKCRPPGNRTPERDEVATCEPFLFRQLSVIRPHVIVALGSPAFQCLLKTKDTITRARGEWRDWNGIKLMPTFHPAYLLRSPDKKREAWEDLKKVRDYLNSLTD